jgi:hypothetical protein
LIEVPQVREGWQGTDDDLRRACEVERANLADDEDAVCVVDGRDSGGTGVASSFLINGFRGVLSSAMHRINSSNADKPCLVWSPTSRLRLIMDLLSMVVLMYDVLSLPYLLAFEVPQKGTVMKLSMISVAFWTVDLAFRFRTGFWHQGRLEMSPTRIAWQYLKSTFALDASLVLLDIVAIALSYLEDNRPSGMDAFRLWRFGKITRIVRCLSFLRLRSVSDIVERVSQRSKVLQATSMVVYDVVRIVFVILWLNHIIACSWVALGKNVSSDTGLRWLDLPVGGREYVAYSSAGNKYQYTTAFHWALTQMTPGSMQVFPVNSSERIFNSVGLVFGVLVFSTLISSISSSVTQFKIGIASSTHKLEQLNRFLRRVDINPDLAIQVRKQVRDKMKEQKAILIKDVDALNLLPLSLRVALELELCRPHLDLNPYFNFVLAVDDATAEELCHNCAEFFMLGKKDTLFLPGVGAVGIFFVTRGALGYTSGAQRPTKSRVMSPGATEMVSKATTMVSQSSEPVQQGQWLSEAALWCDWRHVGTAEVDRAPCCEILRIGADSLMRFMRSRRGAVGQLSWAYARSFHALLSASLNSRMHKAGRPTDLRLPFTADEVTSNLPVGARAFVGCVALRELRRSLSSVRGMAHGSVAWIREGYWPDVERLREDVECGTSALVLSRASKFGVQRVVTMVALQLFREDGRVLVALKKQDARGGEGEGAEAKLPGLRQMDGEFPEQCYQRLLDDYFGAMAPGIVLEGTERQSDERMEEDLGVTTRFIKVVFNARWEPPPAVAERAMRRRGSITDDFERQPSPLAEAEGAQSDLVQTDEVFHLPGGLLVAWFTPEELHGCTAADGSKALGQWLSRITFPLRNSTKRRSRRISTIGSKASEPEIDTRRSTEQECTTRPSIISGDEESAVDEESPRVL